MGPKMLLGKRRFFMSNKRKIISNRNWFSFTERRGYKWRKVNLVEEGERDREERGLREWSENRL